MAASTKHHLTIPNNICISGGRTGKSDPWCARRAMQLLELGRDVIELGVEAGADRVHGGDDHHRNAGGNQSVFDGGGASLVLQEGGKV